MDVFHIILLILFGIFIIVQIGSLISTAMILYNSKKQGGVYCSKKSFLLLIFFWLFTLLCLLAAAAFYMKRIYDDPINIIVNNVIVMLWTAAMLGSVFIGSVALKSTKNNCFQMSDIDNALATITLIVTGLSLAVFDYFSIKRIFNSGKLLY